MARRKKFSFLANRDSDSIEIFMNGRTEAYYILKVFEFNSERKMMAMIVKRVIDKQLILYVKGADIAIKPLLTSIQTQKDKDTFK